VLRQGALDGRPPSIENKHKDGLAPRRPPPVPENTATPLPMFEGGGSEDHYHDSAGQNFRLHPAAGTAAFTAGLRAAMGQLGELRHDASEETGKTVHRTWTSARLGDNLKQHDDPPLQVCIFFLLKS
jgi:hypothetical protein